MIVDPEKMISPSKDPWPLVRRAPAAGPPRRDLWHIEESQLSNPHLDST
jgi:hypothetical protein